MPDDVVVKDKVDVLAIRVLRGFLLLRQVPGCVTKVGRTTQDAPCLSVTTIVSPSPLPPELCVYTLVGLGAFGG